MARGRAISIPKNPSFISINDSDGNSNLWPSTDDRARPEEKGGNKDLSWRTRIGQEVAEKCKGLTGKDASNCMLEEFPKGYSLFVITTDPGGGRRRHDTYLYGRRYKYRSPAEFAPHAIWLANAMHGTCECKYCSPKPSARSNESSGLKPVQQLPVTGDGRSLNGEPKRTRQRRVKTRDVPLFVIQKTEASSKPLTNGVHHRSSTAEQPWFRVDEVVWVKLECPISSTSSSSIRFWPGVIQSYRHDTQAAAAESKHSFVYGVKLLVTGHTSKDVSQHSVLPYSAYGPPNDLLRQIRFRNVSEQDLDRSNFTSLANPLLPITTPPVFGDYVPSYLVAITTASRVGKYFCMVKRDSALSPGRPAAPPDPPATPAESLADAYNRVNANNHYLNESVSASGPSKSQLPSRPREEFASLWYGAENISVGDVVRIKLPRNALGSLVRPHMTTTTGQAGDARESGDCALFVKICRLFMEDAGTGCKCRFSGRLLELLPHVEGVDGVPSSPSEFPSAPPGFQFHSILNEKYEAVLSLSYISGRYYPDLMEHSTLRSLLCDDADQREFILNHCGLVESFQTVAMYPQEMMRSRKAMLEEAESLEPKFMLKIAWSPESGSGGTVNGVRQSEEMEANGVAPYWSRLGSSTVSDATTEEQVTEADP